MTLRTRLGVAMVVLVGLTAASIAWLAHRAFALNALPDALHGLETETALLVAEFEGTPRAAGADMLALRNHPAVLEMVEAPTGADVRRRLGAMFLAELAAKPHYVQLRLINRDGYEVVRTDRSGEGGGVRLVPQDELQQKGDRPYFRDAIGLTDGALFVSAIELNEEFGEIVDPFLPVLRVATPVFDGAGQTAGIVIVNIDMGPALDRLRAAAGPGRRLYLVAEGGEYIVHPDPARQFAAARGVPAPAGPRWPDLIVQEPPREARVTESPSGRVGLAAVKVRLAGGPLATMLISEPESQLLAGEAHVLRSVIVGSGLVVVVAMILATMVAASLTRPVNEMVAAVGRFEQTGIWPQAQRGPGELAVLAKALNTMAESELQRAAALRRENEVRRAAEEALQREAAQLRLLSIVTTSSDDAIYTKTLDGIITSWNPSAERMYGYAAGEAIGRNVDIVVPADRRQELAEIFRDLRDGKPIRGLETHRVTKAGEIIDVSLTVSPVPSDSGVPMGASVIARDISGRKLLEERFRLVIEAAPSGMLLVDQGGEIVLANAEAERLFGYTREELTRCNVDVLLPDAARPGHADLRSAYAADPSRRSMGAGRDLYGRHKDGSNVPIEVGLNPVETRRRSMVLAVVIDISERKQAEDELRRSNAELEQFAYVASHDLQEPLRMVASYTELLQRRYQGQLDERADKYIFYAVDGAKRMQLLINDLLRFSRVTTQAEPFATTDVDAMVRRVVRTSLAAQIGESGGAVEVDDLPTVMADGRQLDQVFQNLISNGLKFRAEGRPPVVRVSAERRAGDWLFSVHDNGIGIESEQRDRVFEMFQRLHPIGTYPGSGIGLPLVRKIIERHHGAIWFESEPGQGTTFLFTLPLDEDLT